MQKVELAIGYDKSLSNNFTYFFPHKIRDFLAEKTNKLALLAHSGYFSVDKKIYYLNMKSLVRLIIQFT